MKYVKSYSIALITSLLVLSFGQEAMARGGVYFSGAVVGAPAYYPYPPYYPPYPYYAYHPPGYVYAVPPAPYAYPAPAVVAPVAPVVGGIGVRIH